MKKVKLLFFLSIFTLTNNLCFGQTASAPLLTKEIQIFYKSNSPANDYLKIDYNLVDTIVYTGLNVADDGSLYGFPYDPDQLIAYAQARGVKVVLLISTTDVDNTADKFLANPLARSKAVKNILQELQTRGFDGVDNDFENGNNINPITNTSNKALMTAFQTELTDTLWASNPNYRISIDVPNCIWTNGKDIWDLAALQDKLNYIMIMGYVSGYTSSFARPTEPMEREFNTFPSVSHSISYWSKFVIDKKKLLLGVPYYGLEWPTVDDKRLANTTGPGLGFHYSDKIALINSDSSYLKHWDDFWLTPWYTRRVGDQWYQGHYDNLRSLGIKYDKVISSGLGGIGIWNVHYGIDSPELWQLIEDKFAAKEWAQDLSPAVVYPNPYIAGKNGTKTINFINLSEQSVIHIYDVSGHLVRRIPTGTSLGQSSWDLRGEDGEEVAGGIYLYVIHDADISGQKKITGKLAIVK